MKPNRPDELIRVANLLIKRVPEAKDALLFCGLGYQALGDETSAHGFYTRALQRMAPAERAVMESVEAIMPDVGACEAGRPSS